MDQIIKQLISIKRVKCQEKLYIKLKRQYKTRKFIINEIINTEKRYIEDLKIIKELLIDKFKIIYGVEETKKTFSNLEKIIKTNEELFEKIIFRIEKENQKYIKNYNLTHFDEKSMVGHENSQIFLIDKIEIQLNKFKSYFKYCAQYGTAMKYRQQLKQNDESYRKLIVNLEKSPKLQQLEIEDYLVKPIQRLPKYILLLKDLKKNTPYYPQNNYFIDQFIHPDYNNICQLLEKFEDINNKNNDKIWEFQQIQKMKELQQLYGSSKLIIHNNVRQFIFEENVEYYISKHNRRNVILLCFNDALLFVEKEYSAFHGTKQKPLTFGEFSLASEITQVDSQIGLMFKITTKNKVHFLIASDKQQFDKIQTEIKEVLKKYIENKQKLLSNNNDNQNEDWCSAQIIVTVEGTEEYNAASIQNYTVYIIKFILQGIEWKLYLRYSQIKEIYHGIIFRDINANIQKLQSSNWFQNHNNKYLDALKINIEGFLQSIFTWKNFEKNKSTILKKLGIPLNFNLLPKVLDNSIDLPKFQRGQSLCLDEENQTSINEKLQQKIKEEISVQKMLKSHIDDPQKEIKEKIKIMIPQFINILEQSQPNELKEFKEKIIYIRMKQLCYLEIEIDGIMKAAELCSIIAQTIGLKSFFDFQLFVIDSIGNKRSLENNQIVLKSLPIDSGIFCNKKNNKAIFDETYTLEFKKYIYLPYEIEYSLYTQDPIRLILLTEEILSSLEEYQLQVQQYILFYSLHILIYQEKVIQQMDIQNMLTFNTEHLKQFLPKSIRKQKQDQYWNTATANMLKSILPELLKIMRNNRKKKNELQIHQYLIFTQFSNIARLILMNYAFQQTLYGVTCFYVSINIADELNKSLNGIIKDQLPNLYLGISFNKLLLLSPGKKAQLYFYNLNHIDNIKVEPLYIIFVIKNNNQDLNQGNPFQCKFKTNEGYKISSLIKEYININTLYSQIGKQLDL